MDEFWVKVISGGSALTFALYALWMYSTGKIVPGKAVEDALRRQAEVHRRQIREYEQSLVYEREQKRTLQEDNEKWVLRYTESLQHIHRAKEVATEAVNTAKEIASRRSS